MSLFLGVQKWIWAQGKQPVCKHPKWHIWYVIPFRNGDGEAMRQCHECGQSEIVEWTVPQGRPRWARGGPLWSHEPAVFIGEAQSQDSGRDS